MICYDGYYTEIDVPYHTNISKMIGINGCNFIEITKDSSCYTIWYNNEKNIIQIWGAEHNLSTAVHMLYDLINNT